MARRSSGDAGIAAGGLSRKWQNALRVNIYPPQGDSMHPAAFVYHKIRYAGVFEDGAVIGGQPLLWLPLEWRRPGDDHRHQAPQHGMTTGQAAPYGCRASLKKQIKTAFPKNDTRGFESSPLSQRVTSPLRRARECAKSPPNGAIRLSASRNSPVRRQFGPLSLAGIFGVSFCAVRAATILGRPSCAGCSARPQRADSRHCAWPARRPRQLPCRHAADWPR